MNLLFYFGHPAQYHFLKYTIRDLKEKNNKVFILIKSKDILEDLLLENGEDYVNILPEGRRKSKLQILTGLIKRDIRLFRFVSDKKINLLIGTDPSLSHVGFLLKIPVMTVLEDDIDVIPSLAKLTFPFTTHIITPRNVRVGKFSKKKIGYDGYMKLAYLHPRYFTPVKILEDKLYFLIRISGLDAYHDQGIGGLNELLLDALIAKLRARGSVYISSEKPLPSKYDEFILKIKGCDIHSILAYSTLLISDSQSMSMEAAMLGVPSLRFSDFAGRISVLEELEKKYGLSFGIHTAKPENLLEKVEELLLMSDLKHIFQLRRDRMLSEKIDVTAFMIWMIEKYPESARIMKEDPDYQNVFRINH